MTTYFCSPWGADANNGLGPDASHATNKPWLTIGKALGAAGIASGDIVYLCPGLYREQVTVAMTSATAETLVIGDVANGQGFKDANGVAIPGGDVIWSAWTTNDWIAPPSSKCLILSGRDFLTFQYISFFCANGAGIDATTKTSTDIKFSYCSVSLSDSVNGSDPIAVALAANVAANWVIDSCMFNGMPNFASGIASSAFIRISVDTPATADFDINFQVKNCVGICCGVAIQDGVTTNTFDYGGLDVFNCTLWTPGNAPVWARSANHSTSIPSTVYNCFLPRDAIAANASGQLVEDYNVIRARTNVAAGAHSVANQYNWAALDFGQSWLFGRLPRPFLSPMPFSPLLGFGAQAGGPSVDILNKARPAGVNLGSFGTATAGAAKTLTDSGKSWGVNQFKGWTLKLTGGTGSGQVKSIASNTGTVVTVDGNWKTNPSTDSTYVIYWGDLSSTGKATAIGALTTMTDANAAWGVNQWAGYTLSYDAGTGSPMTVTVASNTATVLTFPTIATACDTTTEYSLYKASNVNTQDYAVGAFERHDTAQKETATTDAGGVAITLTGKSNHEIRVPVDASQTTITLRCQFDSQHGATNKPQALLLANGEIGVSAETITAVGSAGSWETLTFSNFTPTAKGWVIIRLVSRADAPAGRAFFDTVTVV